MSSFPSMKIRTLMKAGAAVQLARYAIERRRRRAVQRQRRRNVAIGALALAAAGAGAWWFLFRGEDTPAWQRKKLRKEARRERARLERERPAARPGEVHVETNADTSLRAPLGDLKR